MHKQKSECIDPNTGVSRSSEKLTQKTKERVHGRMNGVNASMQ
jgi:hypothetical protein